MWCGASVERAPPPAAFDFGFALILVLPFQTLVLNLTLKLPRAQSRVTESCPGVIEFTVFV